MLVASLLLLYYTGASMHSRTSYAVHLKGSMQNKTAPAVLPAAAAVRIAVA
jgi:hypothetical protein